jgi:hypothetical protein
MSDQHTGKRFGFVNVIVIDSPTGNFKNAGLLVAQVEEQKAVMASSRASHK